MKAMYSSIYDLVMQYKWLKYLAALSTTIMASSAYAQSVAWGGTALCTIAGNTKATIGIAAVVGILIAGVMALFKKGDHLLDTVVTVCIVCGVAFLAVTIISQMGFTVSCAGL